MLVGDQQSQARAAQYLLDGESPAGLVGLEVQQFGDVGQLGGVGTDCGADMVAHREGELRQRGADVLDALEFLGRIVSGNARGLLRVLRVGGRLAVAFDLGQQLGGLGEQFFAQVPEFVGGVRDLDVVSGEQVFVGGATALDLFGLGPGGRHLGLQRRDVRTGPADLGVERIRFGFGQIQAAGDVLVLVFELVDGAVERGDLGGTLRETDVVGVRAHHRRVDEVDDAEVGGLGGVAQLDGFDVSEDLALLLRDGQQFASLDKRVDLFERLGQPGQAVGFVEHELADELLKPANTFQ